MKRAFKNVHSTGIASVKGQGSRKEFENTYSQFCTAYENYKKERAKPKAEGE